MHSSVYAALKAPSKKRSRLEYHVFARFPCNSGGVRIAVTLTEKSAQRIGGWVGIYADEVWYTIKPRRAETKRARYGKQGQS